MRTKKMFLIAEMAYGQSAWSFKHVFEDSGYEVMSHEIFIYYFPQNKRTGIFSKIAGGLNLLLNMLRINLFFPFKKIAAYAPDIIFIFKGTHITAHTIQQIKQKFPKSILINCNLDHPFVDYNTSMSYISSLKYYDIHLTCKKYVMKTLESAGAKKVLYVTCRYDEKLMPTDTVMRDTDRQTHACDVLFLGTRDSKREYLLGLLAEKYTVRIYGNNRDRAKNPQVHAARQKKALYGEDVVKAVRGAKVNLNVLRLQDKYSHNLKNMEIPACGGVLLTERSEEIDELFTHTPGVHTRKTPEEMMSKISILLSSNNELPPPDTRFEIHKVFSNFLQEIDSTA